MKKLPGPILFISVAVLLVVVLNAYFPKYAGILLFLFVFLLFDGYLWFSVRNFIGKLRPALRLALSAAYWLPLALLLCFIPAGFVVPFLSWNLSFRTYLQSFILILFLAKVFPVLTLLIADLARLARWLYLVSVSRKQIAFLRIPRYKSLLIPGWILGGLLFTAMLAGTLLWQFDFTVRSQEIVLKGLPHSFDGMKIVQFSDVHLGSWGSKQKLLDAMNTINGLHPDVIFFTGDMFNYCTADGDGFEDVLKVLHAPYGVYAIMGNHDYGDYISWPSVAAKQKNIADLNAFYQRLGWKLLLNSHDILRHGTDSIAVLGVHNWGASHRFQRLGDIDKAQEGTETMAIQLLLSHDPSHWDSVISKKYHHIDVTFPGHTHGGQVGIDWLNIHWSPVSWAYKRWCGIYTNPSSPEPQYLYVNQGLGNIGYSGRIGIMPEITLVILKEQK